MLRHQEFISQLRPLGSHGIAGLEQLLQSFAVTGIDLWDDFWNTADGFVGSPALAMV
jgi:hypothetical protein